jgi:hypothetical protein
VFDVGCVTVLLWWLAIQLHMYQTVSRMQLRIEIDFIYFFVWGKFAQCVVPC